MPHFGELAAILGSLRRDGVVARVENSLITTADVALNLELREDGTYELREDGGFELRD